MKVNGKHLLNADVATLWAMLQDPEVLSSITPGKTRIERVEGDEFTAVSEIGIGPVRGTFEGEMSIIDKIEAESMTLKLVQKSRMGNAEASVVMNLNALDSEQTEVVYEGTAKVSGRLATMGQRILGGVVSTLSKQVFKELEKIIEERKQSA